MDGDFEAQLGVIDVLFEVLDEENADEFLARLEGLLRAAAFPPDRAVRWAVMSEAISSHDAEAALKLSCASLPEARRLVVEDPVMRHDAVSGVLDPCVLLDPQA